MQSVKNISFTNRDDRDWPPRVGKRRLGLLGCMLRRLLSHRGLAAAAGAAAAAWALPSACEQRSATGAQAAAAAAADALPIYSKAEVAKHTTPESGIWVVFRGDVYDITTFVQNQRLSKPSPMGHGRPEPPERLVGRGWPERGAARGVPWLRKEPPESQLAEVCAILVSTHP